jgi:hypothetical protein
MPSLGTGYLQLMCVTFVRLKVVECRLMYDIIILHL